MASDRSPCCSAFSTIVQAADGSAFVWVTEGAGDVAPGFSMPEYGGVMRKVYEEKLQASIGQGEPARLGDTPAMRFAFEGTHDHLRVKGYLFVAKGRQDFCHLVAFSSPSRFERLRPTVARVIESAVID